MIVLSVDGLLLLYICMFNGEYRIHLRARIKPWELSAMPHVMYRAH